MLALSSSENLLFAQANISANSNVFIQKYIHLQKQPTTPWQLCKSNTPIPYPKRLPT